MILRFWTKQESELQSHVAGVGPLERSGAGLRAQREAGPAAGRGGGRGGGAGRGLRQGGREVQALAQLAA